MIAARGEAAQRKGFALLAVLWVVVIGSVAAMASQLIARSAVLSAQNRMLQVAARWNAEACVAHARAEIDESLASYSSADRGRDPWMLIDSIVASSVSVEAHDCSMAVVPSGLRLDVNEATAEQLQALFVALGNPDAVADSMADVLLDWRDSDDIVRPAGAEAAWYATNGIAIRNGPIANIAELQAARGFDHFAGLDSVLGIESGRISLPHAPPALLASLPGFSQEVVVRVQEERKVSVQGITLDRIVAGLSTTGRDSVFRHYSELLRLTSPEPEFWEIATRGFSGQPRISVTTETRLVRAARRAAVVRHREVH